MDGDMETPDAGSLGMGKLALLLAAESRWLMLEELSKGGAFSVTELSRRARIGVSAGSKHLILLAKAGIVVSGKGKLYTLAPGVLAEGEGREVRMGICTLRFSGEANAGH